MYSSFYGLTFNPFDKQQLKEKDHFIFRDFTEMTNRLNYLKDIRGIGVFYCPPRNGKIVCPSLLRRLFKSKPVPYGISVSLHHQRC